jgi:hypothetical protein
MPEENILVVYGRAGCITLTVWAHFLLCLSVRIRYRTILEQAMFPPEAISIQIIIEVNKDSVDVLDISLLDSKKDVILRMAPIDTDIVPRHAQKHLPLVGT